MLSSSTTTVAASSVLGVWCPRRQHFIERQDDNIPAPLRSAPVIVIPSRQCLTTGPQCYVKLGSYARELKAQVDFLLGMPTCSVWEEVPLPSSLFGKVKLPDQVNTSNVRAWRYPYALTDPQSSLGLPVYRVQWHWRGVENSADALRQCRLYYFDPQYVDDQSDYQLIEKLPDIESSSFGSPTVFRALWRPINAFFTTRDWLEFICCDTETQTLFSRSCLHPSFPEMPLYASPAQWMACLLIPGIGIKRAGAWYSVRFSEPEKLGEKEGCIVEVLFWYDMGGLVQWLHKAGFASIENEYMVAAIRQFDSMALTDEMEKRVKTDKKGGDIDVLKAPFNLL